MNKVKELENAKEGDGVNVAIKAYCMLEDKYITTEKALKI